jgi:hypothetical protein
MMAMGGMVPGPGTASGQSDFNNNFGSKPGDTTPAMATQLGVATTSDVYVWVNNNSLGAGASDYFVFQSGSMPGNFTLGQGGLCWNGAITNLTATLWTVANGMAVNPPVHTWNGNGTCVKSTTGDAPLVANTEYLLGVVATGGAGTYSA